MNNAAPENTAALQEKIAELEQQLKLSDEGASHLAERCLSLEQKVQSYLAAHPQREMHTDSPTLLQPLLYYDAGFGFSEKDTLTAPDCTTDELTGAVTATFELPVAVQALRFDPGELKHGTISLITDGVPVIALATQKQVYEKTISNAKETKSRGARVILFTTKDVVVPEGVADYVVRLDDYDELLMPLQLIEIGRASCRERV